MLTTLRALQSVSLVLVMTFFAASYAPGVEAAPLVIKVGHALPASDPAHMGWTKFKQELEKRSNNRYLVEIFPNQELGSDRELVEACQMGEIQMATASPSNMATFVNDLFILDVPFSFNDRKDVFEKLDGELGKALEKSINSKGFFVLGWWENGFRHLSNNKRPVKVAEDLKGLKIRTMENPVHLTAWKAMGANPTPMVFGEVFTALQQGTIDGQENPYTIILTMRFYEVQKYVTETGHIFSPYVAMINEEYYKNLSTEDQAMFRECSAIAAAFQREAAIKFVDEAKQKIIADPGTQVVTLTPQERASFSAATKAALDSLNGRVNPEIIAIFKKGLNQ